MTPYVSRRYLREKWDALKWDMEDYLRVFDCSLEDNVAEQAKNVAWEVCDLLESIKKEIGGIL